MHVTLWPCKVSFLLAFAADDTGGWCRWGLRADGPFTMEWMHLGRFRHALLPLHCRRRNCLRIEGYYRHLHKSTSCYESMSHAAGKFWQLIIWLIHGCREFQSWVQLWRRSPSEHWKCSSGACYCKVSKTFNEHAHWPLSNAMCISKNFQFATWVLWQSLALPNLIFRMYEGGYSHAPDDLSYGVDMKKIRWCGILQVQYLNLLKENKKIVQSLCSVYFFRIY